MKGASALCAHSPLTNTAPSEKRVSGGCEQTQEIIRLPLDLVDVELSQRVVYHTWPYGRHQPSSPIPD